MTTKIVMAAAFMSMFSFAAAAQDQTADAGAVTDSVRSLISANEAASSQDILAAAENRIAAMLDAGEDEASAVELVRVASN